MDVREHAGEVRAGHEPLQLHLPTLTQPLRWTKRRKVFVCSMTDLFGDWVPDAWIDQVFAVMAGAPQHTFQVLTKRAKRMRDYCSDPLTPGRVEAIKHVILAGREWPLSNSWFGVSVESQDYAWRLNYLCETPAAVRFVSAEPLLGPLDIDRWINPLDWTPPPEPSPIQWVIAGGESAGPPKRRLVRPHAPCPNTLWRGGPRAYPHQPTCSNCGAPSWEPIPVRANWVRALRDQCQSAGVPFLLKQFGGPTPKAGGRLLDGREWNQYPDGKGGIIDA